VGSFIEKKHSLHEDVCAVSNPRLNKEDSFRSLCLPSRWNTFQIKVS